jgi:uncharacterized damage-inducible protein DinB
MDAESIRQMLAFATRMMAVNLEGFTHDEALAQPPGGGNCVNWIVGHVIVHRNHILRALGHAPVWGADDDARYDRGSGPITGPNDALPLDALRDGLERARLALLAALDATTDEALAAVPEGATGSAALPLGQRLSLLMLHEGYHVGQVSMLRRVSGRAGAIR